MYVHTGLIRAAANQGEVAGVLAHEMSHVALRHGAAQISKQQTWGTVFGVLGQAAVGLLSDGGGCGMLCQAAQMGVGLGGNSMLMKFSRGYEHDADLNGARMMNSAGYDPIGLPTFFQKLEAQLGTASEPKGLALWMSSHPATGNRIQYVSQDIQFYPKQQYTAGTGKFDRVKSMVAGIPPAKLKPAALLSSIQANPRQNVPQGLRTFRQRDFLLPIPQPGKQGRLNRAVACI
jgi:predicted Zn-dependent protease